MSMEQSKNSNNNVFKRALGAVWWGFKKVFSLMRAHKVVTVIVAVAVVLALGLGLGLGLTLPTKSVELEGEVVLLQGEEYVGGLSLKATTRAGLVHKEDVLPAMLCGYDPDKVGTQTVTVRYKGFKAKGTIKVLGADEVRLEVREGSLPAEFEPMAPFPTSGVFDLYYGEKCIRSVPVSSADATGFDTALSGEYEIDLTHWGCKVQYHYSVLAIVQSITASGKLYVSQGTTLSKSNLRGTTVLHVEYKDGTSKDVMLYDEDVTVKETVVETRDGEYETVVTLLYKGVEVPCENAVAYQGELLAPKSVTLNVGKTVYKQGEYFDYEDATLSVVYERFGDSVNLLVGTQNTVFLVDQPVDSGQISDNYVMSGGGTPILFDSMQYYYLVARYNDVTSAPVRIRVITEEDAGRVTNLVTTWRGGKDGLPQKGQDLNFENAVMTVEYGFGYKTKVVSLTPDMVSGYDKNKAGDQTLTIVFDDYKKEIDIRVPDMQSNKVTRLIGTIGWENPDYYTYYSSNDLVIPPTAKLETEIGYGASYENVAITRDMISGFTPHTLEKQILTITYGELSITMAFTVQNDLDEEIIDFWAPNAIHIKKGALLDLSEYDCTVFYSTGRQETPSVADVLEAGGRMEGTYDVNVARATPYFVEVFYPGYGRAADFTWIYVESDEPLIQSVRLDVPKGEGRYDEDGVAQYALNEPFDVKGVKLWLVYDKGEPKDITEHLPAIFYDTFYTTEVGRRTAQATYLAEGVEKVATYEYRVVA